MKDYGGYESREARRRNEELSRGVTREVFSPGKQEMREAEEKGSAPADLMGAVEQDAAFWQGPEQCADGALACQEAVARSLLGGDFSSELMEKSARICEAAGLQDNGALLEKMGLEVTRETGCGIRDICQVLGEGGKVIVRVNGVALRFSEYARRPGVQADHTVQVIGVDAEDPRQVKIIFNDPGSSDGRARSLPQQRFEKAWEVGDCAMTSVYR